MLLKPFLFTETENKTYFFFKAWAFSLPFKHHHLSHSAVLARYSKHKIPTPLAAKKSGQNSNCEKLCFSLLDIRSRR